MDVRIPIYILFYFLSFSFSYAYDNRLDEALSRKELKNGISLFNERKYTAAIQTLEMSLSYEPSNYVAKYWLGMSYLHAGYSHNAILIWEDLVRLGVANHEVLNHLNMLYFRLSVDKSYKYDDPYIFREYYDGFSAGKHDIIRSSFIIYDKIKDRKFVASSGNKRIVEMDGANNIIQRFGPAFFFFSRLKMPMGMVLHDDLLYVSDYKANKIFAFDRHHGLVRFVFGHKEGDDSISGPMGLVVGSDHYLYAIDNGHGEIKKYRLDGTYVYSFGNEYLYRPTGIIFKDNMIYVSDIQKHKKGKILQFNNDGEFIREFGEDLLEDPRGLFLDSNEIFISDMKKGIIIYNLDTELFRSFMPVEKRLSAPFDLVKDKDKIIWQTDINSQKIAIYTPLQGVYGNIDMSIYQILTDKYPRVYAKLRIRNRDGSPMIGINPNEIKISEFNSPVADVLIDTLNLSRKNMVIQLLIDSSLAAEQFKPKLEYYLKSFLNQCSGTDQIEVVLLDGNKKIESGLMQASVTKIWQFVNDYKATAPDVNSWDTAIYTAITRQLNTLSNKAIVIFSSGAANRDSFMTYGADILQTYGDQNSVPIYTIHFTEKNEVFWKTISEKTHGIYYQSKIDTSKILDLYNTIKIAPPLEYLVEFHSHNYSLTPNLWIELTCVLERFGVSGMTSTGYYMQKKPKKSINLEKINAMFIPSTKK